MFTERKNLRCLHKSPIIVSSGHSGRAPSSCITLILVMFRDILLLWRLYDMKYAALSRQKHFGTNSAYRESLFLFAGNVWVLESTCHRAVSYKLRFWYYYRLLFRRSWCRPYFKLLTCKCAQFDTVYVHAICGKDCINMPYFVKCLHRKRIVANGVVTY